MPIYQDLSGGAAQKTIATAINSSTSVTTAAWNSSQNISFTSPNQTATLPVITAADFGKTITLRNTGTNSYLVALSGGTINSAVGLTMLSGSVWTIEAQTLTTATISSTNASQNIAEEYSLVSFNFGANTAATPGTATLVNLDSSPSFTVAGNLLTLKGGRKYLLRAQCGAAGVGTGATAPPYMLFEIQTAAGVILPNQVSGNSFGAYGGTLNNFNGPTNKDATVIYTPAADTQIRIQFTSGNSYSATSVGHSGSLEIKVLSTNTAVSSIAAATAGDRKFSDLLIDHGGNWILLDGRLKSALTVAQQAVATALGYGANIPDLRGKVPMGISGSFPALTSGGSFTIAQNQLPNVALSISGSASQGGNGIWWYNGTTGNARMPNGGGVFDAQSTTSLTVSGSTASINGNVAQQSFVPSYATGNWFVWLGSSVGTVTTVQPLSLTTTPAASGATFNSSTGVLNVPAIRKLLIGAAGNQTATNATYINQNAYGTTFKNTFGASWNNVTGVFTAPENMDVRVVFNHGWSTLNSNANTILSLRILHSGGQSIVKDHVISTVPQQSMQMSLEQPFALLAGETLTFGAYQSSGTSPTFAPAANVSKLSIIEE